MAQKKTIRVATPPGRLSFPAIFAPEVSKTFGGDPKYSATILIPKQTDGKATDISALVNAVKAKLIEGFPNESTRPLITENRGPIKDGDTWRDDTTGTLKKVARPEFAGCWVIKATAYADNKPSVVDQNVQPILDQSQIKAGYWVRLGLTVTSYDKQKKGVKFNLASVQLIREDETFGSSSKPEDFFDTAPIIPDAPVGGGDADIFN